MASAPVPQSPNKLLALLPPEEYRRVSPALQTLDVCDGTVLPGCGLARVYFPGTGMVSVQCRMSNTATIEVASIGNEGVVGLSALGSQFSSVTYVHVSNGRIQYIKMNVFEALCSASDFGSAVEQFCVSFTQSMMQLVACNRVHSMEARCARWILQANERLGRANFEITQPFLATAIGAKREDLEVCMAKLVKLNIVKHTATSITILDRIALRRLSCSCFTALKKLAVSAPPAKSTVENPKNVLQMRSFASCTLCGLSRNTPHKSHDECLRAIDSELRDCSKRSMFLLKQRKKIALESMEKFSKFLKRRRS